MLGKPIRKTSSNGYVNISIYSEGKRYTTGAHQYAWFIIHNELVDCIYHINGVKTDNRICNLRSVSKSLNALNTKKPKGVYYCKRESKWIAYIMINYKRKQLGSFLTEYEARYCYIENKKQIIKYGINGQN